MGHVDRVECRAGRRLMGDEAEARARWLDMIHRSESVMPQFGDSGSAVLLERGREPHGSRLQMRAWGGEKAICGARGPAGLFHPMLTRAGALVCPQATVLLKMPRARWPLLPRRVCRPRRVCSVCRSYQIERQRLVLDSSWQIRVCNACELEFPSRAPPWNVPKRLKCSSR